MKVQMIYLLLVLPLLLSAQESAFLGIHSNHVSKKKAKILEFENDYGNYVTNIIPNTAAEKAGLEAFDYIYAFDDKPFSDEWSMTHALRERQAGDQVKVSFIRNGKSKAKKITLGARSNEGTGKRNAESDPFLGVSPQHKKLPLGIKNGVVIALGDEECTTAALMGLQDGDIITAVDQVKMVDWHDLTAAIDNRDVGDKIQLTFLRNGIQFTKERPIKSLAASEDCEPQSEVTETVVEMAVDMENVSAEEAADMKKKKGIDMPIVNDLSIERLNIFPNPSNGMFELRFELPERGDTRIRLFNSVGQQIYLYDLGEFSGSFSDRIDISNEMRGIYFLELRQGVKSISKKLIVQ